MPPCPTLSREITGTTWLANNIDSVLAQQVPPLPSSPEAPASGDASGGSGGSGAGAGGKETSPSHSIGSVTLSETSADAEDALPLLSQQSASEGTREGEGEVD